MPIYEIMPLGDELKEAVLKGASCAELKKLAREQGMMTLREAGIARMKEGVTTLDEVLGKTNEDSEIEKDESLPQEVLTN